jgi:hypothetical protein
VDLAGPGADMRKNKKRQRGWGWLYGANGEPAAFLEEHADGWHRFIDNRDVGTFASEAAARQFVDRIIGRASAHDDANGR